MHLLPVHASLKLQVLQLTYASFWYVQVHACRMLAVNQVQGCSGCVKQTDFWNFLQFHWPLVHFDVVLASSFFRCSGENIPVPA